MRSRSSRLGIVGLGAGLVLGMLPGNVSAQEAAPAQLADDGTFFTGTGSPGRTTADRPTRTSRDRTTRTGRSAPPSLDLPGIDLESGRRAGRSRTPSLDLPGLNLESEHRRRATTRRTTQSPSADLPAIQTRSTDGDFVFGDLSRTSFRDAIFRDHDRFRRQLDRDRRDRTRAPILDLPGIEIERGRRGGLDLPGLDLEHTRRGRTR